MATVNGSLELIKDDGDNQGLPVMNCDPASVPLLASVLFGLTGIAAVTPPRAGVVGEWTAMTPDLHNATLLLHQETAFDLTALGRWLAGGAQGSM